MDGETTVSVPARTEVPGRRNVTLHTNRGVRGTALFIGLVVLLFLAFYGGRAYQNGIDQKLFTAYNPPATGARGGAFSGGGGVGGGSSLVTSALSVGNPPGTASGARSSASASSNFGFGAGASTGSGTAANRIAGTLASISATQLSVTSFSGVSQPVAVNHSTRFYQSRPATASDLKPGGQVTILATGTGNKLDALSVSIGSRAASAGGGRFGGFGRAAAPTTSISGTIAHASASSISLAGRSTPIALTSTTRITRQVSIQPSQLASGSFVTVSVATVHGTQTATSVVSRATGAGGNGGGFGSSGSGG